MKKIFITITAVGLLFVGCKNDEAETVIPIQPELKASVSGTSLPDFREGDAVGLYMYNGETALYENIKYTVGSNGTLTTADVVNYPTKKNALVNVFAYYPYSAEANMTPTVTLPTVQYKDFDAADYDYKVATVNDVAASEDALNVTFNHLLAQVKINIAFDNDLVDLTDDDIANLMETAYASLYLKNVGTVNFQTATAAPSGSKAEVECSDDAIALVYPQPVAAGVTLGTVFYTENGVDKSADIVTSKQVNIEANKQTEISITVQADATLDVAITVKDWEDVSANAADASIGIPDSSKVIDLSAIGTANCYVVNTPNQWYKFDATVQGNGKATLGITPKPIAPAKARILWGIVEPCTTNGGDANGWDTELNKSILKASVSLKDGYVYFRTPGHIVPANVVICVTDEADKILWSWHMWCVEGYAPEAHAQYIEHPYVEGRPVLMDRNLGAYRNAAEMASPTDEDYACSQGMHYEWGRKDPFPGSRRVNGYNYFWTYTLADGTVVSGDDAVPTSTGKSGNRANYCIVKTNKAIAEDAGGSELTMDLAIEYTVAHPYEYIIGTSGSYCWMVHPSKANNVDLGNGYGWDILWGNNKHFTSDPNEGQKSIYDPCPVGWRVPAPGAMRFFTSHGDNAYYTATVTSPWKINIANLDRLFDPNSSDGTKFTVWKNNDAVNNQYISAPYGVKVFCHGARTPEDPANNHTFGVEPEDKTTLYFPAQGHLAWNSGAPSNSAGNKRMMVWENTGENSARGARAYILMNGSAYYCGGGDYEQPTSSVPVRCMQEQ